MQRSISRYRVYIIAKKIGRLQLTTCTNSYEAIRSLLIAGNLPVSHFAIFYLDVNSEDNSTSKGSNPTGDRICGSVFDRVARAGATFSAI